MNRADQQKKFNTEAMRGHWVPEWAKHAIWYQIFPERFRNGNRHNDPTLPEIKGAYPNDDSKPWQVHPWTSDWYKLQSYEERNGRGLWFNILRRRYGGDLEGIVEKLDYLQELGVNALYLNPVFDSPSHHKYDGASLHHIDPNFGPDPQGDRRLMANETPHEPSTWVWTSADRMMLDLIREVHRRKMRIIFDGVFNHMGVMSPFFRNVQQKQSQSPYRDWFKVSSWQDAAKGTTFRYRGWWGISELPELRQTRNGLAAGPRDYVFDATRRWMDPNGDSDPEDGIDGWRLDVAFCIAHPFWKAWREHVKAINPAAYLSAEIIDGIEALRPYLAGDEFDAVMNYNFAFAATELFCGDGGTISAADQRLRSLRAAFPGGVEYVMQNLLDSHDSDRVGSHIVNRAHLDYRNWMNHHTKSKALNPRYDTRKPTSEERRLQKLMALFQMTYVGAPMIYYGDEAGMWGANDPCCRKPMVWPDYEYEPESVLPSGAPRASRDEVAFDADMFGHYRKLIKIRSRYNALQVGEFRTELVDEKSQLYVFSRTLGDEKITVALNRGARDRRLDLHFAAEKLRDVLNDETLHESESRMFRTSVPAKWGRILAHER